MEFKKTTAIPWQMKLQAPYNLSILKGSVDAEKTDLGWTTSLNYWCLVATSRKCGADLGCADWIIDPGHLGENTTLTWFLFTGNPEECGATAHVEFKMHLQTSLTCLCITVYNNKIGYSILFHSLWIKIWYEMAVYVHIALEESHSVPMPHKPCKHQLL